MKHNGRQWCRMVFNPEQLELHNPEPLPSRKHHVFSPVRPGKRGAMLFLVEGSIEGTMAPPAPRLEPMRHAVAQTTWFTFLGEAWSSDSSEDGRSNQTISLCPSNAVDGSKKHMLDMCWIHLQEVFSPEDPIFEPSVSKPLAKEQQSSRPAMLPSSTVPIGTRSPQ